MIDTIIVGSGLAGMTAAVQLAAAGQAVHVIEANKFLGGRTSSWNERGMEIESGFHRFLGFYAALPDVLQQVGVNLDDMLCWEDEVEIRMPDGPRATFGSSPLHKPFKTAWDLLGHNDFLPPKDKLALGAMFAAGAKEYIQHPLELDKKTVAQYAAEHNVSDTALHRILIPATEGIFFVPPQEYSMHNLMGLVIPYIKSMPKLRVGAFRGGMSAVMIRPMADYISARNGTVTLDSPVRELIVEGGAVTGVRTDATEYRVEHVVLAASLHGAQQLLKPALGGHPAFADMLRLPTMPAVTFQIELTEPSMELDRTTFGPDTCMTSFAEQSRTTFRRSPGRLSVILSPPERFIDMPEPDILKLVTADAARLGIALEDTVKDYRKVVLPHDFYSLCTGSEALRPAQRTDIPGLTLAGDYTKQPYLATMEGAVVSGKIAADVVLGR